MLARRVISILVSLILIAVCSCRQADSLLNHLESPDSPIVPTASAADLAGYSVFSQTTSTVADTWYGIQRVSMDDMQIVADNLGGTVIEIATETQTAGQISAMLDRAEALGYKVILNMYTRETSTNRPWDLDRSKSEWVFPQSTVETLQGIAYHPALFAIYALHEPLDAGEAYVSVEQQRELYQLLKEYTDGLPVYSDMGGLRIFEDRGVELADGICDYCCVFPSYFRGDWTSDQRIAETLSRIDAELDTQQRLMPNSQLVFLVNTYSYPGYSRFPIRLPTPEELAAVRDYLCTLNQPMLYYPWSHGAYDASLKDAPQLWPVVADGCSGASTPMDTPVPLTDVTTMTVTLEPTATKTPTSTDTPTLTDMPKPTATKTPTPTGTPVPTDTPEPSPTVTPTSILTLAPQTWYGVARSTPADWSDIASLGPNVVDLIVQPSDSAADVNTLLDQAKAYGFRAIVHIYDRNTPTKKPWRLENGEWVISQQTIDVLRSISDHPAIFAIYALHEPLDAGEAYVSVEQQRELYQLLKEYTDGLPVFSDMGGLRVFEDRGVELTDGICDYCCVFPSYFRSDWTSEQCVAETLRRIDAELDTQQRLMPNSQVVFLINTYSYPSYHVPIRLPTPEELAAVRNHLCALNQPLMYYPWTHGAYDVTLKDAPQLWLIIAEGCAH